MGIQPYGIILCLASGRCRVDIGLTPRVESARFQLFESVYLSRNRFQILLSTRAATPRRWPGGGAARRARLEASNKDHHW